MSWSASCEIPAGSTDEQINEAITVMQASGNDDCPSERYNALQVAKLSVAQFIASGVVGDMKKRGFKINLSGHCNPGNEPREGWANDFVNIQVIQS